MSRTAIGAATCFKCIFLSTHCTRLLLLNFPSSSSCTWELKLSMMSMTTDGHIKPLQSFFSPLKFFAKEKAMRLADAHVLHIRRGQNSWPNGRRWRKKKPTKPSFVACSPAPRALVVRPRTNRTNACFVPRTICLSLYPSFVFLSDVLSPLLWWWSRREFDARFFFFFSASSSSVPLLRNFGELAGIRRQRVATDKEYALLLLLSALLLDVCWSLFAIASL